MTLSAKKIHCARASRTLFQDVCFTIRAGELLQVVGNNGTGKSSLLRILAGLLQPTSGDIFWNNQSIAQSDFHQHLFYLGHSLAIKSELTVKENILFSGKKNHFSDDAIKKMLAIWSLNKNIHHLCGTLSQGQKQRVALARLQLSAATVWILDEPFAHCDAQGITQCKTLFQTHLNNGGMIVLSTHRKIATKSMILDFRRLSPSTYRPCYYFSS